MIRTFPPEKRFSNVIQSESSRQPRIPHSAANPDPPGRSTPYRLARRATGALSARYATIVHLRAFARPGWILARFGRVPLASRRPPSAGSHLPAPVGHSRASKRVPRRSLPNPKKSTFRRLARLVARLRGYPPPDHPARQSNPRAPGRSGRHGTRTPSAAPRSAPVRVWRFQSV